MNTAKPRSNRASFSRRNYLHWGLLCLVVFLVGQTHPAVASPGDEHWGKQFGWPGTSNIVFAIAEHNGRIYSGGALNGGLLTNGFLNVWDGVEWSSLAEFRGSTVVLYDLAFVGNFLYAAGLFTNVNGVAASGLARWDGTSWSSIGFKGAAFGLVVDGNNLYVAGSFTNAAGSAVMTNIGCWDGTAWRALGDGLGNRDYGSCKGVAAANGLVYVGGQFTNSGSQAINNLAVWNGTAWSAVGGGVNNFVYGLALQGLDLYVGGIFTEAGGTPANYLARWNGVSWSDLAAGLNGGLNGGVNGLVFHDSDLCVTGSFTNAANGVTNFALWNGSTWRGASSGLSGAGSRVASVGNRIYAGGNFLVAGGGMVNGITYWDGAAWNPIGPSGQMDGLQTTVRALANDGTNLIVGGSFLAAGRTPATRIGRYDGRNWQTIGPGLNAAVNAVAVVGTNIYAGGDFTGGGNGPFAFHLAAWNGAQWVPLNNAAVSTVSSMATRGGDLFVAGYFGVTAQDGTASWLTRWDGTNFWNVLNFESNSFHLFSLDGIGFTAMAIQGTNIYLSGNIQSSECDPELANCTNCNHVLRFDGTYGRIVGSGLNTNATAIAVVGTNVYFGGPFTNAGGIAANRIARWDGRAWSSVGGGVVGSGTINALAVMGTNLYAGGSFTNVGGVPANRIARWNGNTWSALGSGTFFSATAGPVLTLNAMGSDLYVGGTFRSAGGKASYYLARWNETINFDAAIRFSGWGANPFHSTVTATAVSGYVIEGSTDLTNWTAVMTNSTSPFLFTDPSASGSGRRFYRARALP
jgi:trimeric autotransporter adhesin